MFAFHHKQVWWTSKSKNLDIYFIYITKRPIHLRGTYARGRN